MVVTIKSYRDSLEDFLELCSLASRDVNNPAANNHDIGHREASGSVHRQMEDGKYDGVLGDYNLIYYDDVLVGGGGYYKYDDSYVLACTRAYVVQGFRKQHVTRNLMLFQMVAARDLAPRIMVTFNDYNERIYRARLNRPGLIPELWSTFTPMGRRIINYVEQYCWEREIDEKPNA